MTRFHRIAPIVTGLRPRPLRIAAALFAAALAWPAHALNWTIDSDRGTINGVASGGTVNGTRFTAVVRPSGMMQFRFEGDLNIAAGDLVTGTGSRAVSMYAGNNATVGAGARFNFSANGTQAGPGGGGGGGGGAAVAGGAGGRGGDGGDGGAGGAGSDLGGALVAFSSAAGSSGRRGTSGSDGSLGASGRTGNGGSAGQAGFGSTVRAGGGNGGSAGTGSSVGSGAERGTDGGAAGVDSGSCINVPFVGQVCTSGNGERGSGGTSGGSASGFSNRAGSGQAGSAGSAGRNTGSGLQITGGGGGGGGGSGGSGSGGGGGGGGGGGQGGGGGAAGVGAIVLLDGGGGGGGGGGGAGGTGGNGGTGGSGQTGSGGGGAFEIVARGRVTVDGATLAARGAGGNVGASGTLGASGLNGQDGGAGTSGSGQAAGSGGAGGDAGFSGLGARGARGGGGTAGSDVFGWHGGNGGSGGLGGTGARGQSGGNGGAGGSGGNGAGGTVKLYGTLLSADGTLVDVAGGATGGAPAADAGRLVVGANGGRFAGTWGNGRQESFDGLRGANPFLRSGAETPTIADLQGGAEVFGLLNLDARAADFDVLRATAPGNARAALMRLDLGPTGYGDDYAGFDMLLFLNLTDALLDAPMLGMDGDAGDGAFLHGLLGGGWATLADFGGSGAPSLMSQLSAWGAYATLVPEGEGFFSASVGGLRMRGLDDVALANGEFAFLTQADAPSGVPEPGSLALLGLGALLAGSARRRRG